MELLIGTKKLQLSEPWRAINSEDSGPSAVKAALGWILKSPLKNPTETISDDNTHSCATVNRISIENVEQLLVVHCKHDFSEEVCDDKHEMSVPGELHGQRRKLTFTSTELVQLNLKWLYKHHVFQRTQKQIK